MLKFLYVFYVSLNLYCIVERRQNMCGFCGFLDSSPSKKDVLTPMMDALAHRGPDSGGQYIDNQIGMGFRRLSIVDVEEGSQPLYNEDSRYVLTFNGEIYNHASLREKLEAAGHIFKTATDSEVLIHGYEEYGSGLLSYLRGMFAFVIWDKQEQTLFGARDFFGIKPFYYYHGNNQFIYGSELKSLLQPL